ncbi:hypothetical protein [Streptomyces sp. NPDC058657]|uniref:hypothetical protein n=1 Tax=unclassified Streptomyces TaxID=2593676 RepID=UPI003653ACC3
MGTGLKVAGYALVLAATFGGAYGIGSAIDPVVATEERPAKAPAEKAPADHGVHGGGAPGQHGN